MSDFLAQGSFALLVSAAIVFTSQVIRQERAQGLGGSSFPTILLVVIILWIATEAVSDTFGTSLGLSGEWAHLAVMFLLALCLTLQLRQARQS